jgi:CHAT domain-containing protein
LYRILIEPVEPFLDKNKYIYVVPDKILNYLPFHALKSPGTGRYLIEDHVIGFDPSSSIFILCTEAAAAKDDGREERLLAVGNPSFNSKQFPSLTNLTSAASEATKIASGYKSGATLIEDRAREKAVWIELPAADVIHLASHYVIDKRSPMHSGLLLAAEPVEAGSGEFDGLLQISELFGLKFNRPRLAVLSACQTGIEQSYRGEGAFSFARSFIKVGVPIVAASLWPVDSNPTKDMMIGFHDYRRRGHRSTIEALRQAQLDMLKGDDPAYRHPYFWASFVIIGGHARY